MRLKGVINNNAIDQLERNFLPALEKLGKTCEVLFSPEQVFLVQRDARELDGAFHKLELPTEFVFSEVLIESRKDNYIAFTLTVALLTRIFTAARAIDSDSIEVRLTQRDVVGDGGAIEKRPLLAFTCRSVMHSMEQELPISRPYPAAQVDEFLAALSRLTILPWYVNVKPHTDKMEALLHSLKTLSPSVTFLVTRAGEVHLQVTADNLVQGMELSGLMVYPTHEGENAQRQTADTTDQRFAGAMNDELNAGPHAELQTKQFIKALAACQLVEPDMLLMGVNDEASPLVHVLCVFQNSLNEGAKSDLALHVWLPVIEEA